MALDVATNYQSVNYFRIKSIHLKIDYINQINVIQNAI